MTTSRWISVVVLLLLAIFAFTGGRFPLVQYQRLTQREQLLRLRLDSLAHDVDSLAAFRDSLRDRSDVQERVARARSGMIRPGEIAVLLVPEGPGADSTAAP